MPDTFGKAMKILMTVPINQLEMVIDFMRRIKGSKNFLWVAEGKKFLAGEPCWEKKVLSLKCREEWLSRSCNELELSIRTQNYLVNANINTIGELVEQSESTMIQSGNFGRQPVNEIKEALWCLGLSLKK